MHARFVGRAQVSRYEKFGFGVLVMHLAATHAGAVALHAAGFFRTILDVCGGAGRVYVLFRAAASL